MSAHACHALYDLSPKWVARAYERSTRAMVSSSRALLCACCCCSCQLPSLTKQRIVSLSSIFRVDGFADDADAAAAAEGWNGPSRGLAGAMPIGTAMVWPHAGAAGRGSSVAWPLTGAAAPMDEGGLLSMTRRGAKAMRPPGAGPELCRLAGGEAVGEVRGVGWQPWPPPSDNAAGEKPRKVVAAVRGSATCICSSRCSSSIAAGCAPHTHRYFVYA